MTQIVFYAFVYWEERHAMMRVWELQLIGCGSFYPVALEIEPRSSGLAASTLTS